MVRKIVVSPSILSHHTTVVGPEGTIAYFIFPYSGRIGKGRIRIKQKEGNKTIVALVAYTSTKGVVTNYKDAFDKKIEFDISVIPYKGNDNWIEQAILDIHKCLMSDSIPESGPDCDYCRYRKAIKNLAIE